MSLASSKHPFNNPLLATNAHDIENKNSTTDETEANLSNLLGAYTNGQKHTSMDRGSTAYTQSDNTSVAQYTPHQEVRSNNYPTTATPTSEFGSAYHPTSARSANFPDNLQRGYQSGTHSSSSGGMAQPTNPSIAASSPTYATTHGGQHSPYPQQDQMAYNYQQHPSSSMYTQPRPDWSSYSHGGHPAHGAHAGHHPAPHSGMGYQVSGAPTPTSTAPAGRAPNQVYSFVPIPGAQQHKRPRRRYEEIERMYKCGHQGCEKAYGTLNHLNAHVTMQSHGNKRTPEEFKEIRKEWKQRKKDEEMQRKEADSARSAAAVPESQAEGAPSQGSYAAAGRSVQLPPIGGPINYQPGAQVPNQYQHASAPTSAVQQLQSYNNGQPQMDSYSGYPASPYGTSHQMYSNQSNSAQPKYEH